MAKNILLILMFIVFSFSIGQNLDISGYKIIQTNSSVTVTLPAGTMVEPGGYVIICRGSAKGSFESAWGTTLPSNVVFLIGNTLVGGSANGFPVINGSENYTLQNALGVTIDGPTVSESSTSGGDNLRRININSPAGTESSWIRSTSSTITNANPGTGMTNTNSGKLIISEISDASAYANEFIELFYDATPLPKGEGSMYFTPSKLIYTVSSQIKFVFKPETNTIHAFKIVKPSQLSWNSTSTIVTPITATINILSDTITISSISVSGTDSIVVVIQGATVADTTDEFIFNISSSFDGTTFLPLVVQPKLLSIGLPRALGQIKTKDNSGNLLLNGKWVVTKGIVTVANEFNGPSYIQDATGAIAVYDSSVSRHVERGDEIILLGKVSPYNDMFELQPCSLLDTLSEGNPLDTLALTIQQIKAQNQKGSEPYECRLIRVNNITSVISLTGQSVVSWAGNTNYYLLTGSDSLEIRVLTNTNLVGLAPPSKKFDIVGTLGQYTTYYQIQPRSFEDIIVEGSGPRITSSTPYESNITSTSITFQWQTDIPGSSLINYGKTTAYGITASDTNKVTLHRIVISGLKPATVYHLKLASANGTDTTYTVDYVVSTSSQSSTGVMNVYFNKSVDTSLARGAKAMTTNIAQRLIDRIHAATYSVDAALYSLSGTVGANIASELIVAKNRNVKVRVIGERDNSGTAPWSTLLSNSIPLIFDDYDATNAGAGLMHNKFVVIDNQDTTSDTDDWLWTGSWNATDPGNNDDAQNAIEIQDKALANAYTLEFNEMWGSTTTTPNASSSRFGAHKTNNTPHYFIVHGTPVELYFSPSDGTTGQIIKTLNRAVESINFALLTFTRSDIANALTSKYRSGVKVRGVMDNRTDTGSEYDTLLARGIDIHLKANVTGLFHHKYAIVDANGSDTNKYVITGSHNWSSAAENSNNENTLIIKSPRIANLYVQEFSARYKDAGGTAVLLEVEKVESGNPKAFVLSQNYPNPFNPVTTFSYQLPQSGKVVLKLYNLLGQEIATVLNQQQAAGSYKVTFDASNLSSGIYFYRLQSGGQILTRKMLLIK